MHLIEAVPQSHQFRFSHALIRETLYDEMLGLRRSRLHLRIGEMLEQRHGTDDAMALAQLAYHFSEAGPGAPPQRRWTMPRRSAEHAAQLLAFEEAARLYRLALAPAAAALRQGRGAALWPAAGPGPGRDVDRRRRAGARGVPGSGRAGTKSRPAPRCLPRPPWASNAAIAIPQARASRRSRCCWKPLRCIRRMTRCASNCWPSCAGPTSTATARTRRRRRIAAP